MACDLNFIIKSEGLLTVTGTKAYTTLEGTKEYTHGVGWRQNNFNKINWEGGKPPPQNSPPYHRRNHRTGSDTLPNIIHMDPIYF